MPTEYKTVTYDLYANIPNEIRNQAKEGWAVFGYWFFESPVFSQHSPSVVSEHIVTYIKTKSE